MKQNIYTTKILDIILPEGVICEEKKTNAQIEEQKENMDPSALVEVNIQTLNLEKLDHIFIVMEKGKTDLEILMRNKPKI